MGYTTGTRITLTKNSYYYIPSKDKHINLAGRSGIITAVKMKGFSVKIDNGPEFFTEIYSLVKERITGHEDQSKFKENFTEKDFEEEKYNEDFFRGRFT